MGICLEYLLFWLFWCRNDAVVPLEMIVSRLVLTSLSLARIWANGVTKSSSSSTFLLSVNNRLHLTGETHPGEPTTRGRGGRGMEAELLWRNDSLLSIPALCDPVETSLNLQK